MAVNIPQLSATKLYNYHYDQLNRIVAMDMYNGLNPNTGTFTPVSDTSYKERVSYDPNGNILGYLRNGDAGKTMDSLNYKYYASTNKLSQVTDSISAAKYTTDIDNQVANNYTYDAIGNMISDAGDSIYSTSPITWNVYGKIMSVTKNGRVIRYVYDAGGNRIMKYTNADTTVYVRDATGNVLSVYSKPTNNSSVVQTEMHLYGSSRLGMATQHLATDTAFNLTTGFGSITGRIFTRGEKLFELSNHLGNVLATISDRRIQVDGNSDGTVDSYKADMVSANDYYPFGMLMPGRKYSIANTNYRFGFNGKENDNDIGAADQDYGARIYDGRLGRFLSADPLTAKYPYLTPYQFASNSPISGIDMDGLEYYFSADGRYFDHRTIDSKGNALPLSISNDVRIAQQVISTKEYTIYKGVQSLHTSYDVFMGFAALLNLESSGKKDETYAIANTTINYLEKGGTTHGLKTLEDVSLYKNSFARGATQENYSEFIKINPDKQNRKFAIGAAINAIAYSKKLNGSFYDDTKGATG